MPGIFICGFAGFVLFDLYRLYRVFIDNHVVELFFGGWLGVVLKLLVAVCAGVLGIAANLDVILGHPMAEFWSPELIGCYLRAFGIGLAGPAGISKFDSSAGIPKASGPRGKLSLDTLEIKRISFQKRLEMILRRQFLR